MRSRIAIIGTGISGLGAAWALHGDHDITVFEARDRLGGHSQTVEVESTTGPTPVDTGFIEAAFRSGRVGVEQRVFTAA
jgi:predicted NAD/FAD-binding protein